MCSFGLFTRIREDPGSNFDSDASFFELSQEDKGSLMISRKGVEARQLLHYFPIVITEQIMLLIT